MAEGDEDIDGEEGDITEGLEAKKTSGKKIVIIVAAVIVLALIGWGAMMFMGGDGEETAGDGEGVELSDDGEIAVSNEAAQNLPVYHQVKDMLVNLDTGGRGIILLRVTVSLELESEEDRVNIEQLMPAIMNDFQVYLRSLRPDDLEGTKGLTRIQEELLVRINQSITPFRIRRILFEDFLITPQ